MTTIPVEADAPGSPSSRPGRKLVYGWGAVLLVCGITIFGQLDRGIMALLVEPIKADTRFTDTQISLLLGLAYSMTYMCAGLPMARVADTGKRVLLLLLALIVWSSGTLFCGISQNFWQFFVARGVVGAGEAVKGPTTTSLITDQVPREALTRAMGIYNLAVQFGESLALIIGGLLIAFVATLPIYHVPVIGELHSWRLVYLIFAVPGIAYALIFMATVGEPQRRGRKFRKAAPIREVVRFLTRGKEGRVAIPYFVSLCLSSVFLLGAGAWRPSFYERTYHVSPAVFGPFTGTAMLITAPIGVIIGTWIYERLSKRYDDANVRMVIVLDAIMIPFGIAGPLMPNFTLAIASSVFANLILMMGSPARSTIMQLITPNEMRAQVNAVMMFTIGVVGGIGPTVIALITDHVFGDESMLRYSLMIGAAICYPLTVAMFLIARKPFGELNRKAREEEAAMLAQPAGEASTPAV
ncbi:MFS transporter [Sphingobium nicotianae]|uniref:MFS transporter n=1 Tax=Sphingobium nicotianae TaxID=2782607 RepID=A0A9X1ISD5_9SPHN|nr:MFS transporter [Sphingobium nicotianae]MBT2188338.1 MFS transporter [Sphingobium nicotianae]